MKVNTKPVQRVASRFSLSTVVLITLFALLLFMSRSCFQLPQVVSAITGREENEGSTPITKPVSVESAIKDEAGDYSEEEPSLKPWKRPPPVAAGDMTQQDDEQADDVVMEAEQEKTRWEKAQAEREAVAADEVIKEEEREEDAAEDADAGDDRHEDDGKAAVKEEKDSDAENCLPHIFYDKPIKTGSTAVTYALREYVMSRGGLHRRCSYDACTPRAAAVCNGTAEPEHLIGHIRGKEGQVECMKSRRYYAITTVRDPLERWTSAFLFNKMMKGTHYGIPWQEPFATFMEKYPDCTLYHYYDQMGSMCRHGKIGWRERLKKIVDRYDEVIDLYDGENDKNGGKLFQKIKKYIAQENVSMKPKDDSLMEEFDRARLEPEQALYDALKAKRLESPDSSRVPC